MKRNAFGQLVHQHHPHLQFFAPADDTGGGGGGEGGEYKPPATQEDLDKIIKDRVARADKKAREEAAAPFKDFEAYKTDAEKFRAAQAKAEEPKTEDEARDKRITAAEERAAEAEKAAAKLRDELVGERVQKAYSEAMKGRVLNSDALFAFDQSKFAKDGQVDADAIKEWVSTHSAEIPAEKKKLPGQGERGESDSTGLESGRAAYERRHPKKTN